MIRGRLRRLLLVRAGISALFDVMSWGKERAHPECEADDFSTDRTKHDVPGTAISTLSSLEPVEVEMIRLTRQEYTPRGD